MHEPRCRSIYSPGTGESTTEGCTSPFGCAAGELDRGPLRGTFFATVDMIAPSAGMPSNEPPSTLSLSVTRVFTPDNGGTLTFHSTGVFDTSRGLGSEAEPRDPRNGPLGERERPSVCEHAGDEPHDVSGCHVWDNLRPIATAEDRRRCRLLRVTECSRRRTHVIARFTKNTGNGTVDRQLLDRGGRRWRA
jgi:hypothetical protein